MRKLLSILVLIMVSLWMMSCSQDQTGPIRVGVLLPLTGAKAKFGEMEKNSFELARSEINAAGGVNGRQLEFIYEDDTGKPDVGRMGMEKLITADKVPLVTGGYSSSVTFAAAQVAQKYKVPFLVNTGSVDKITEPEAFNLTLEDADKFYVYRLNPPVSEYASGLEGFIKHMAPVQSAIIFHENTTFGTKGASAFEKSCSRLGIEVLDVASYTEGTVDFKPLLLKVKELNPELVYMISYVMDAALLMKQAKELQLNPKLFVGAGAGYTMPAYRENAGIASEKTISATLWHQSLPIPGATDYYNAYIAKYGDESPPDYHGVEAYAAAYVVKDALARAKSLDRDDIKQALDATDLMTAFGPVKFASYGSKVNQNEMETYVVQWIDGQLELIWPKHLARIEPAYPIDWQAEWDI